MCVAGGEARDKLETERLTIFVVFVPTVLELGARDRTHRRGTFSLLEWWFLIGRKLGLMFECNARSQRLPAAVKATLLGQRASGAPPLP